MDKREAWKGEERKRDDDDKNNLVRLELLSLFPNCKTLSIQSARSDGSDSFSFSLMAFLNVISQSSLNQIIIKSYENRHGYNWIKNLWNSDEQILKKEYAARNYEIEMKKEKGYYDEYRFEINKL